MIRIDEPLIANTSILYHSNCLTCNDPSNTILNIITTPDKYEAMILANEHLLENGDGHQVTITYSRF